MSFDIWLAFAAFAFVSAVTPGPNNLLLLASGLRVGLRGSLPFMLGINLGFSALLVATGYGLGQLFQTLPAAQLALKIAGTGYFLWLAIGLLRAGGLGGGGGDSAPGFGAGVILQAVNPKAWIMCITAVALYLPAGSSAATLGVMVATFVAVGLPAHAAWAGAGQSLRVVLGDARRMRLFGVAMAVLLMLSILPVWLAAS